MHTLTPAGRFRTRRALSVAAAGVSLGAVLAAVQLTGDTSHAPAAAAPPEQDQLTTGFVDSSSHAYFRIELDPAGAQYGHFALAVPGVGLVWASGAATVANHSTTSTTLEYDGSGYLDADAVLDTEFGVRYEPRGTIADATVRLRGEVDSRHGTGALEIWVNGRLYHVAGSPQSSGADPVAVDLTTALRTQDWHAVYVLADDTLRGDMSESEFASWIDGELGSGTVDDVRVTGPATYATNGAGVSYAQVPVHEAVTVDGQSQAADATLVLIYDRGSWRWLTTK